MAAWKLALRRWVAKALRSAGVRAATWADKIDPPTKLTPLG